MSKLEQLLAQQKKLEAEILAAKREEAEKHEKSFQGLYRKFKLDRFDFEVLEAAIMTIAEKSANAKKSVQETTTQS